MKVRTNIFLSLYFGVEYTSHESSVTCSGCSA